jgi:hypothetical protein
MPRPAPTFDISTHAPRHAAHRDDEAHPLRIGDKAVRVRHEPFAILARTAIRPPGESHRNPDEKRLSRLITTVPVLPWRKSDLP